SADRDASGNPLATAVCSSCPANQYPSADLSTCIPCPAPQMLANYSGGEYSCNCRAADGFDVTP
ncbi:hypothetical protein BDK51DRAFT_12382, partial [Blyttiomyces helicus]